MKLVIYAIGGLAIALFTLGIFLYILMQWGALVEYHAFEWRGVQPTMKSPLTKATGNLSYWFLGTGFLASVIAFYSVLHHGDQELPQDTQRAS